MLFKIKNSYILYKKENSFRKFMPKEIISLIIKSTSIASLKYTNYCELAHSDERIYLLS